MKDRPSARPALRRALGRWDLTALGVNQVIGGAIFLMPSQVAAQVGAWGPLGFMATGLASLTVALCFAEVSSRFEGTGGPYLYARSAFGRFVGFEVGWMQWFTRASSQAAVMSGLAVTLGYYWPTVASGAPRAIFLSVFTVMLASINVRGVRQSAWLVNALTIGKMFPLALFVVVGAFAFDWHTILQPLPRLTIGQASSAALLLVFIFGGYDVISVPAGEALNPRRDVPFAFVSTIVVVTVVLTAVQIVAQGVLADLPGHATPLADASARVIGPIGAMVIAVGSILSMTGNNAGQIIAGSRILFALGEGGDLPALFGRVHARFRTPANAIAFTSALALGLALGSSFERLAVISAVARLLIYTSACAATLALRRASPQAGINSAAFVTPLGALVPVLGIAVSAVVIVGATGPQLRGGILALVAGAAIYAIHAARR